MLKLRTSVVLTDTDYGVALLDELSGQYWVLNPSGVVALRAMLDGDDTAGAVDAVIERYDVDRDTATRDVTDLIAQLRRAGIAQ
jgi:hypothetical protein